MRNVHTGPQRHILLLSENARCPIHYPSIIREYANLALISQTAQIVNIVNQTRPARALGERRKLIYSTDVRLRFQQAESADSCSWRGEEATVHTCWYPVWTKEPTPISA